MAMNDWWPATRGQLKVVKSELEARIEGVRAELGGKIQQLDGTMRRQGEVLFNVDRRLTRVEETMATKEDVHKIYEAVLDAAEKGRTYFEKMLTHQAILQSHEAALKNHGQRIGALESRGA